MAFYPDAALLCHSCIQGKGSVIPCEHIHLLYWGTTSVYHCFAVFQSPADYFHHWVYAAIYAHTTAARGEHPLSALLDWLQATGITSGPIFRHVAKGGMLAGPLTVQSVALIAKAAAKQAKLDPTKYSGHSLRAGLIIQAAKNGVAVVDIMRQTGHRSTETVNKYIRKARVFEDNASARLGL